MSLARALDALDDRHEQRAAIAVLYPAWNLWGRDDRDRELWRISERMRRTLERFEGIVWC
jgi:hypothetical protein